MHTPSLSSVTPLTSTNVPWPPVSTRKSKRESPWTASRRNGDPPNMPPARRYSAKTALGAWESMLTSRSPLRTATRSYRCLLSGFPESESTTGAPGTRSSLHLPVFFTWTASGSPSTRTSATNLLGLETNSPHTVVP